MQHRALPTAGGRIGIYPRPSARPQTTRSRGHRRSFVGGGAVRRRGICVESESSPTCAVGRRFVGWLFFSGESDQALVGREEAIWTCSADLGYFHWQGIGL